jgi:hypothetical protein
MSVSVFDTSEVIYSGYFGYADKENGVAVDQDTVMEWGSATKLLVWVSVMQLWEQGKLDFYTTSPFDDHTAHLRCALICACTFMPLLATRQEVAKKRAKAFPLGSPFPCRATKRNKRDYI